MTSITFSSKKFGALFKWSLTFNKAVVIIYSVLLAIAGPVITVYAKQVIKQVDYETDVYQNDIAQLGMIIMFVLAGVALLFTFIMAAKSFSYVHSKRCMDMYGALPSDRGTMYLAYYTSGVLSVFVPYLIATVIVLAFLGGSSTITMFGLQSILVTLLTILASYAFTALIAYCCGTVVDTVIISLVLNFVWLWLVLMFFEFREMLIFGTTFEDALQSPLPILFAPYAFGFYDMARYMASLTSDTTMSSLGYAVMIVWEIVFTLGVFAAGYFMAKKRRSECAQSGFAVAWLPMAIKALASVAVGSFAGYMFAAFSENGFSNMAVYAFWYLLFGAITVAILHIIFQRGVRGGWIKSFIVYACTAVLSMAVVLGMCYGMGVDTYVPNADNVKAVTMNDYYSYYSDSSSITFTDEQSIKNVVALHQMIADHMDEISPHPTYLGYGSDDDYPYSIWYEIDSYGNAIKSEENSEYEYFVENYPYLSRFAFSFSYVNSLGFKTTREYGIVFSTYYGVFSEEELVRAEELVKQIYSSAAYKENESAYFFDDDIRADIDEGLYEMTVDRYEFSETEDEDGTVTANGYAASGYVSLDITDSELMEELYNAMKADITECDSFVDDTMFWSIVYDDYAYRSDLLGDTFYVLTVCSYDYSDFQFIIPSSYTNTLKVLSKNVTFAVDSYYTNYYGDDFDAYSYYLTYSEFADLCDEYCYGDDYMLDEIYSYLEQDWISRALGGDDEVMSTWYAVYYDDYYSRMEKYIQQVYSSAIAQVGEEIDGETTIFDTANVVEQVNKLYEYSTTIINEQISMGIETGDIADSAA